MIYPAAWRQSIQWHDAIHQQRDDDPSAARRQSIQRHNGDPQRCDSDPSTARWRPINGKAVTFYSERHEREIEGREAQ
nr:hypothetical protein CFP56_26567 [Quercus suber]